MDSLFLSGFYSKDIILEIAYSKYTLTSHFVFWIGSLSSMLTAFYSFRLIFWVFFGETRIINKVYLAKVHELPFGMAVPLGVLCIGSIFSGYFLRDIFVGMGTDFFQNSIFVLPSNANIVDSEFIPLYIKLVPTIFSLFGLGFSLVVCNGTVYAGIKSFFSFFQLKFSFIVFNEKSGVIGFLFNAYRNLFNFLSSKWYFDAVYYHYLTKPFIVLSFQWCFKYVDQYFLKLFGPTGISAITYHLALKVRKTQSGLIYKYAFFMCYALLIVFFILWFSL